MKQLEIKLPCRQDNSIDISEITPEFEGIIIGFDNDKTRGFIYFNPCINELCFTSNISTHEDDISDERLIDLIKYLISRYICTSFKTTAFE